MVANAVLLAQITMQYQRSKRLKFVSSLVDCRKEIVKVSVDTEQIVVRVKTKQIF